jgi:hypothetical protein
MASKKAPKKGSTKRKVKTVSKPGSGRQPVPGEGMKPKKGK